MKERIILNIWVIYEYTVGWKIRWCIIKISRYKLMEYIQRQQNLITLKCLYGV